MRLWFFSVVLDGLVCWKKIYLYWVGILGCFFLFFCFFDFGLLLAVGWGKVMGVNIGILFGV